jgi:hypothetical protein
VAREAAFRVAGVVRAEVTGRERSGRRADRVLEQLLVQVTGDAEAIVFVLVLDEAHGPGGDEAEHQGDSGPSPAIR